MTNDRAGRIGGRRVHDGRVVALDVDQVRFPDGSEGELEIIRHPGGAAVLPVLGDRDAPDPELVLIRQYRYAADGPLIEIPAGRLDPGEPPAVCAARELREETGYRSSAIEPLFTMFSTPGFTDERIHLFLATGLEAGEADREADEFVEVVPTRLSAALAMVQRGEIRDAKTALALLYAAGFRLG